jgi:RNA polymerase sigma factor (sigma-70 family)
MMIATIPANLRPHLQHDLLSVEEERSLLTVAKSGDLRARNQLVTHNLRLVAKIAGQYRFAEFDDQFQAGIFGLIKAIARYRFDADCRFGTCAWWSIFEQMQLLRENRTSANGELLTDRDPTPMERLELCSHLRAQRKAIWSAIRNWPKVDKKILILRLLGHTWGAISQRVGRCVQTCHNRYNLRFPELIERFNGKVRRRLKLQAGPTTSLRASVRRPTRHRITQQEHKRCWPRTFNNICRISRSVALARWMPLQAYIPVRSQLVKLSPYPQIDQMLGLALKVLQAIQHQLAPQGTVPPAVTPVFSCPPQPTNRGSPERSPPLARARAVVKPP